jgi:CRISPR-associated endonuclease/helicase Cas3
MVDSNAPLSILDLNFHDVFRDATRLGEPYPYQCRLACGPEANPENADSLRNGTHCHSLLINIPTGLGKTAAVIFSWLWNRMLNPDESHRDSWPRRLVYCLPMRTLVEQTRNSVKLWLERLNLSCSRGEHQRGKISLHILMGGEDEGTWDLYPEREAILIGTQDMLLSRALNRGYGMSRYRWPMHFGLLNNDCLWVYDEVQLMGSGLPSTAQLEAFRAKLPSVAACRSWWMSATGERDWLSTVDFNPDAIAASFGLSDEECESQAVRKLLDAPKRATPAIAKSGDLKLLAKEIVSAAEETHSLTLAVVNTVRTARKLLAEVEKLERGTGNKPLLLHSRFRPNDRAEVLRQVLESEGVRRIVISTQVVEAGVDISATTLFTELAPWTSLVQRFGRCNRRGEPAGGKILWIEPADPSPYTEAQIEEARHRLSELPDANASPRVLERVSIPASDRPLASYVIRRKDLIELFDTTPDLAGNDIDIDRWVREVDDSNVHVFWRTWAGGEKNRWPGKDQRQPRREELCPASINEFRNFLKKAAPPVWRWDFLEGDWQRVDMEKIYPGQTYLLPAEAGGYSEKTGWTPESKDIVTLVDIVDVKPCDDATDEETLSKGVWQSIGQHTDLVCAQLDAIMREVWVNEAAVLRHAARWHDWGKAHEAFQAKLSNEWNGERKQKIGHEPAAKAPKMAWLPPKLPNKPMLEDKRRKYFRHELASALGVLQPETPVPVQDTDRGLVAYLIAAHHGKVRLSIRSLPGEWPAPDSVRFARGVWENDRLPRTLLGREPSGEIFAPSLTLSLEPMELGLGKAPPFAGLPSWTERVLALRDSIGPFRLAFLETLLRAADERASILASSKT